MEKRKRKGKAFIILFLIVLAILLLVFEFSKNTLWGWGLLLAAAVVFLILHQKVLKEKKGLIRFLSFAVFLALSFLIYRVSYPPYQRIPAVDVKDPVVTGVVTVSEGDLTGVFNEDQSVEVYAGIPYAKPPVGELRWREPEDPDPWEGVRSCDHFAPKFMQAEKSTLWDSLVDLVIYNNFSWFDPSDNYREAMSEDALYVNIWKPAGEVTDCPVLFYVHGGSLQSGSPSYSQYNGEAYAKRGIVFVDFAYRLNVFGYFSDESLATESENGTTGNYGLLDQIRALSWVHDNIAAFGGDPSNITIAGESAGSSSVNALCVSPLAKGLFRRAIGESSGIAVNKPYHTFRPIEDALEMKTEVYDMFGAGSLADLRDLDAKTLVKAVGEYNSMTVDGYAIPDQPAEIYRRGENNEEALLSGYNGSEAYVFTIMGTKVTKENYLEMLTEHFEDSAEEIAVLYPAGEQPKDQYNTVMGAAWFAYSHYTWSRLLAAEGRPVYEYCFSRKNKGLSDNHAGELPYFYGNLDTMPQNYTDWDYTLSDTIMDYIENFVRTGDPNGAGLPTWEDFSAAPTKVLRFQDEIAMTEDPYLPLYEILDESQGYKTPSAAPASDN